MITSNGTADSLWKVADVTTLFLLAENPAQATDRYCVFTMVEAPMTALPSCSILTPMSFSVRPMIPALSPTEKYRAGGTINDGVVPNASTVDAAAKTFPEHRFFAQVAGQIQSIDMSGDSLVVGTERQCLASTDKATPGEMKSFYRLMLPSM